LTGTSLFTSLVSEAATGTAGLFSVLTDCCLSTTASWDFTTDSGTGLSTGFVATDEIRQRKRKRGRPSTIIWKDNLLTNCGQVFYIKNT
ncbi:hypothetical protein L9F63_020966, partial [Diploptera punctata]